MNITSLLQATRNLAVNEGVNPTPLSNLYVMKISQRVPYHRGRNTGLSLAVAASGRKALEIGSAQLVNDERRFLVLFGERSYDAVVEATAQQPYIALKLQLPSRLIAETLVDLAELGYSPSTGSHPSPPAFCGDVSSDLAGPLLRLVQALEDPVDCKVLATSGMREICYRLLRSEAASMLRASVTREDTKLIAAMHFIEANALGNLTVAEIASEAGMSPSHFAHRFRNFVGVSPMRYRKEFRLNNARLLLLDTTATVAMAANAAGYASEAHFSRDFTGLFGLSPGRYAREMKTRLENFRPTKSSQN